MNFERIEQLGDEWEEGLSNTTPPIGQVQHRAKRLRQKRLASRSMVAVVPVLVAAGAFGAIRTSADNVEAAAPSPDTAVETSTPMGPPPDPKELPQPPAPCDVQDPGLAKLFTDHIQYLPLDGSSDPDVESVDDQLVITSTAGDNEIILKWPGEAPPPSETEPYIFAEKNGPSDYVYIVPSSNVLFPTASQVAAALDGTTELPAPDPNSDLLRPHLVVDRESLVPELEKLDPTCGAVEITATVKGKEVVPLTYQFGESLFDSSDEEPDTDPGPLVVDTVVSAEVPANVVPCADPSYDRLEEDIAPAYFPDPELALSEFVRPVFGEETPWGTSGYTEMRASDDLYVYVVPLEESESGDEYIRIITVEQTADGWTVTSAKGTGC